MTEIRESIEGLQRSVHELMRTVRTLSAEQFTQPMNGWSPHDVVAHLIGWNRAAVEIATAISRGETPAILVDPGEDFSDVNAGFVRAYASTDMVELLRELELAYQELARHLFTVTAENWTRQVAVPGWNTPTTIEENVHSIAGDCDDHRREIEEWRQARAVT